ncbi:MAG TPA: FAD-dependent oxidoreductase [Intrasporangium sp.]|uniref:FAD-dependent oxidoreductase n=1 Tax=Intrasporangium sp. TaxID=1925024 RepID=UPI002D77EAEC|nr:FAD-dependent oxidoreductase [Intrasporangium sp.]HET7399744.1 FAD-dependent oxidoreductase [Intrasporangium sp.]
MTADLASARHVSMWLDGAPPTAYPPLERDRAVDVAVVGGGITGLTTGLLLARAGLSVCLLDRASIATGTSGHTTAKVTSQHHLTYARLQSTHGRDGATAYGAAMEAAKEQVAAFADEGIDCDLRRRPAYVYAARHADRVLLEREAKAAREAGLPATLDDDVPLPLPTSGGLRFDNQVELHPRAYLLGLADRLMRAGGEIAEHTTATSVDEAADGCVLHTDRGTVRAGSVVVATLLPFLDRGGHFARAHPTRSYVVTARVRGDLPQVSAISAAAPLYSVRSAPFRGEELLLVLGQGHRLGSRSATPERYAKVAEFAQRHWDVVAFEHRWSAQDYTPDDGVPYIGRLTARSKRIHVATGYKKWGMTAGTLAGMLLSDAILGRPNPWAALFSSTRVKPLAEAPRFLSENGRVALRLFGDRVLSPGFRGIATLRAGEGAIVTAAGHKVAGYRDDDGRLHAVSARCTHLGCQVAWNAAERSWDCPCHGSRFDPDGQVIEGPATEPLGHRSTGAEPPGPGPAARN